MIFKNILYKNKYNFKSFFFNKNLIILIKCFNNLKKCKINLKL